MNRLIADRPRPGTSAAFLTLSSLGLDCPADLSALYGLIGGFDTPTSATIGEITLFPGYYMLSLDEAVETYRSISADEQWDRRWLPFLASGGGDFYAVICDEPSHDHGAVVGFLLGEPEQTVEFSTIGAMLETISAAYSEGVFYLTGDHHLKADYPKMRGIARRVQPNFVEYLA
ncbi:SMI1/KNR4 family protein [Sphingomonas sp. G-3-2-10]|uniref:SMI1/KNR4 family protein n=1 Tax=Sphingomonas sp. G-3-2-10 TaxID=2728838 RepID=UPI00146F63A5|nr:SMI1/KNR4 family protein [Sphingomonas sp. G-3-2-10]NML04557.1 SMI1/KNR4 family protein [Sphingomonas sp. G-3-2-10]